ncbi:WD40-repeat-containing domain protein [Syncephalastrum racemosum]|uniref:WD40-repeat-containing domain protein n=1 Tax=Syncephalastrum racemosum TaxID=13706 RepID=A0A1X2GZ79_SYNRA|nr:WD40-repeat-containing domain protein [Syncephalastrum racemosum]
MIEIFDVQRPGELGDKIAMSPSRKSREGQKGIISCIDFSPDYAGIYAAGSYSQSVGLYDEASNRLLLKLSGIEGGVTQVRFSLDGSLLFTASRSSNVIRCWDIRETGNILYTLPRAGNTNQRIHFDIDPSGRTLVTGDQDGKLLFYDIATGEIADRSICAYEAHQDIVTAAAFNPVYPHLLATASGQRKYAPGKNSQTIDNTLRLWRLPGHYETHTYDIHA